MTRRAASIVVALVVAALVASALLVIPASPLHQTPTLGLDLQGGLEVTLAGGAAEGPRADEGRPRPLGRRSCATASTGSASPSPRSARRATTRSRSSCRASRTPRLPRRSSARPPSSSSSTSRRTSCSPSIDARTRDPDRDRVALRRSSPASRRSSPRTAPSSGTLFDEKKKLVAGPVSTKDGGAARSPTASCPRATSSSACPPDTRRHLVRRRARSSARACRAASPTSDLVLPASSYDAAETVPEMTGADLKLSGTRQDFDTQTGEPIVLDAVHERRAATSSTRSRASTRSAASCCRTRSAAARTIVPALRDRARPRDQVVAVDRLAASTRTASPARTAPRSPGSATIQEAKDLALVLQTGALPVEFVHARPDGDLGDARQGLAATRRRSPRIVGLLARRALPARLLPLPRPRRRDRPRHLRRASSTPRSSLFNVTLTLPGFAGLVLTLGVAADANVVIFERIKEEVARGRSPCAPRSQTGYTQGLRTRSSTRTSSPRSRRSCSSRSRRPACAGFALMLLIGTAISMLTAVLATRAFLVAARRLQVCSTTRSFMGADGRRHPGLAEDRLHRQAPHSGSRSPAPCVVISIASRSRSRASTSASTSRAARRSRSRRRRRVRSSRCARRRRSSARANAVIQGRGAVDERRVHELPDPHRVAHGRRAAGAHSRTSANDGRRGRVRGQERVGELRPPDREGRDPRDHRLAAPDRRLHLVPLPVAVRGPGDRRARSTTS